MANYKNVGLTRQVKLSAIEYSSAPRFYFIYIYVYMAYTEGLKKMYTHFKKSMALFRS